MLDEQKVELLCQVSCSMSQEVSLFLIGKDLHTLC